MKKVIFTVDVEGHVGKDPVDKLIYGNVNGKKYGIDLLMDICEKHNVQGIFFVDIAEAFHYGEANIAGVLRHIYERGHVVGVHIHPDHMADSNKLFLYEYSYDEQFELIKKCTDFYESVLGEKPVVFRAGKYGANQTTLDILSKLGYKADFSEFYGQKWCGIEPAVCGTNTVRLANGIIEVPTMTYKNSCKGVFERFDKLDTAMPISEYRSVLNLLRKDSYTNPIVLFAHSFSLITWRSNPDSPRANDRETKKLNKMFGYIANSEDLEFALLSEILDMHFEASGEVSFPEMKGIKAIWYMIPRAGKVLKMRIDTKLREFKQRSN